MDRARKAVPVANYVTYDRHRQTQHKKHRRKVTAVKASVDASVPFSHANRRPNVKREQILEERYYEIERDNRHLLKKINDMHNEPHESRPSPNKRVIQNDKRRLEMKRITAENQRLAARIQNCKPTFSSHELVKHAQKHEKRMVNACHLPIALKYVSEVKKGEGGRVLPGVSPRTARGQPTSPLRRPTAPKSSKSETSPNKARVSGKTLSSHAATTFFDTLFAMLLGRRCPVRMRNTVLAFLPHRSINALLVLNVEWRQILRSDLSWLHARDIGQLESLREGMDDAEQLERQAKEQAEDCKRTVRQSGEFVRRAAERVALQTTICSEGMSEYEREMKLAMRTVHAQDPTGVAELRDLEAPSEPVQLVMSLAFATIFGPDIDASWENMKRHLFPSSKVLKECLGQVESGDFVVDANVRQLMIDTDFASAALETVSAANLVHTYMVRITRCHDILEGLEPQWDKLDEFNSVLSSAAADLKPQEDELFHCETAGKLASEDLLRKRRMYSRFARQLSQMQQPQNRDELANWEEG